MKWHSDFGGKGRKTYEQIDQDAKEIYEITKLTTYEQDRPRPTARTIYLYNAFGRLNRRRIEYRPLQKSDILEELELSSSPDIDLGIIENLDSYWLDQKAKELKNKAAQ